jgi:hypothetical protein
MGWDRLASCPCESPRPCPGISALGVFDSPRQQNTSPDSTSDRRLKSEGRGVGQWRRSAQMRLSQWNDPVEALAPLSRARTVPGSRSGSGYYRAVGYASSGGRTALVRLLWKGMSRTRIASRPATRSFRHPASTLVRGKDFRRRRPAAEWLQLETLGARNVDGHFGMSTFDETGKPICPRDESGNHPSIRASLGHGFVRYSEGA